VVAVGVVRGDAAELVAGQFRGPGVVRRGLLLRVTEDADEGGTGGADVWVQ
jgi:hypothetical protein